MINTLSWLGTLLQIAGALSLAARFLTPRRCYMIMAPGALALLGVALARHDWPQTVLMLTFTLINIWGLIRWRCD